MDRPLILAKNYCSSSTMALTLISQQEIHSHEVSHNPLMKKDAVCVVLNIGLCRTEWKILKVCVVLNIGVCRTEWNILTTTKVFTG